MTKLIIVLVLVVLAAFVFLLISRQIGRRGPGKDLKAKNDRKVRDARKDAESKDKKSLLRDFNRRYGGKGK